MAVVSFMSANFVARVLDYSMTQGWMEGDRATNQYFRDAGTFEDRFDEIVRQVAGMGFGSMDLWTAHLNPSWATERHVDIAINVLVRHQITISSLAGYFGDTASELSAACALARSLGTDILGGGSGLLFSDRQAAVAILSEHDVRLAIENHPEKTPDELLGKIGDGGNNRIGAAIDTGWFATQGFDAARAVERLGQAIFHVHLKDILPPEPTDPPGITMRSLGHETCAFGRGIVPIRECIRVLADMGYQGALSIEHEPEDFDPSQDVLASLRLLQQWMAEEGM